MERNRNTSVGKQKSIAVTGYRKILILGSFRQLNYYLVPYLVVPKYGQRETFEKRKCLYSNVYY